MTIWERLAYNQIIDSWITTCFTKGSSLVRNFLLGLGLGVCAVRCGVVRCRESVSTCARIARVRERYLVNRARARANILLHPVIDSDYR